MRKKKPKRQKRIPDWSTDLTCAKREIVRLRSVIDHHEIEAEERYSMRLEEAQRASRLVLRRAEFAESEVGILRGREENLRRMRLHIGQYFTALDQLKALALPEEDA